MSGARRCIVHTFSEAEVLDGPVDLQGDAVELLQGTRLSKRDKPRARAADEHVASLPLHHALNAVLDGDRVEAMAVDPKDRQAQSAPGVGEEVARSGREQHVD